LAKRNWILKPEYFYESVSAEQWLPEKDFEDDRYPSKVKRDKQGPLFSGIMFYIHANRFDSVNLD